MLKSYTLHNSTVNFKEKFNKKATNKICRFCRKPYPEVSFINKPHIIPELFGRNNIVSNFECDTCNEKFQPYESEIATIATHYHGLLDIKTKKGFPKFRYKSVEGKDLIILKNRNLKLNLSSDKYDLNQNEKKLTIEFETKKFSPFSIYKIFLKMGISLLTENELNLNEHYLDFLNSDSPINNGLQLWTTYRYMLKTKYHIIPKVELYKANNTLVDQNVYPEYLMILYFANIIFQFFLPFSEKNIKEYNNKNNLDIELFRGFIYEDIQHLKFISIEQMDLNEMKKISFNDKITLYYSSII